MRSRRGAAREQLLRRAVLGDEGFDVFLGDAAAEPGAGNLGQIDIVLFGDLADQRAGADASLLAGFRYSLPDRWRSQAVLLVGRQIGGNARLFA